MLATMIDVLATGQRIKTGERYLDEQAPAQWQDDIALGRLNLKEFECCVIGQLTGGNFGAWSRSEHPSLQGPVEWLLEHPGCPSPRSTSVTSSWRPATSASTPCRSTPTSTTASTSCSTPAGRRSSSTATAGRPGRGARRMSASFDEPPMRMARVSLRNGATRKTIEAYMPDNYSVVGEYGDCVLIAGHDHAGWTLDEYVIPRLASGLHFAHELATKENHQ